MSTAYSAKAVKEYLEEFNALEAMAVELENNKLSFDSVIEYSHKLYTFCDYYRDNDMALTPTKYRKRHIRGPIIPFLRIKGKKRTSITSNANSIATILKYLSLMSNIDLPDQFNKHYVLDVFYDVHTTFSKIDDSIVEDFLYEGIARQRGFSLEGGLLVDEEHKGLTNYVNPRFDHRVHTIKKYVNRLIDRNIRVDYYIGFFYCSGTQGKLIEDEFTDSIRARVISNVTREIKFASLSRLIDTERFLGKDTFQKTFAYIISKLDHNDQKAILLNNNLGSIIFQGYLSDSGIIDFISKSNAHIVDYFDAITWANGRALHNQRNFWGEHYELSPCLIKFFIDHKKELMRCE